MGWLEECKKKKTQCENKKGYSFYIDHDSKTCSCSPNPKVKSVQGMSDEEKKSYYKKKYKANPESAPCHVKKLFNIPC